MEVRRLKIKASFSDVLLIVLFVIVIIAPNATTFSRICKVAFGVAGLLFTLTRRRVYWFYYITWIVAVCILACISVSWALSKQYALDGAQTIVLNSVCQFLFIQIAMSNSRWKTVAFRCCALFPIIRFLSLILTFGFSIFGGLRVLGQEADYNAIGFFGALGVSFCLMLVKDEPKFASFWKLVAFFDLMVCVLSMSRKAILYLAIPIIVGYLLTGGNVAVKLKRFIVLIGIVVAGWMAIMHIPFFYKFVGSGLESILNFMNSSGSDSSAVGRSIRITYGLQWFSERPFWGYGARNFNYMFAPLWKSSAMVIADNNYIDVLVSFGIVGLCIYYFMHVTTLLKAWKKRKSLSENAVILVGILIALIACDYGVSSYIYLHSQIYLAVTIMGICETDEFKNIKLKQFIL